MIKPTIPIIKVKTNPKPIREASNITQLLQLENEIRINTNAMYFNLLIICIIVFPFKRDNHSIKIPIVFNLRIYYFNYTYMLFLHNFRIQFNIQYPITFVIVSFENFSLRILGVSSFNAKKYQFLPLLKDTPTV